MWIRPTSEATLNEIVKQITDLQDMGDLEGDALDFAEGKGYGPFSIDEKGWTLLHHAVVQSQHRRGMLKVVRGLLEVMPINLVNQKTTGGTPSGWAALSLVCNARDHANVRKDIACMLVENGAELEVRNANGATPLMNACACGNRSLVRNLLDVGANHHATNYIGRNALDVTPRDQTIVLRATKGSHRC